MSTLFFVLLGGFVVLLIAATAVLSYELMHAVHGYEDDRGFHGLDPSDPALTSQLEMAWE
ncbi:MAG: hypothetical protein JNG83_06075 [Opitutaceae bacterium]|nr:hypothetical protein [Opitutaceae bacterium]